jgi:hypothetical protein
MGMVKDTVCSVGMYDPPPAGIETDGGETVTLVPLYLLMKNRGATTYDPANATPCPVNVAPIVITTVTDSYCNGADERDGRLSSADTHTNKQTNKQAPSPV